MKKIWVFLTSFLFSHSLFATDLIDQRIQLLQQIQQEVHELIWQAPLPETQLQLLLNLAAASYGLINAEIALAQEGTFLNHMSWHFRFNNDNNELLSVEHFNTIERSYQRFKNLLQAKRILKQAYETIMQTIEEANNEPVFHIIETMQQHATTLIIEFCTENASTIEEFLQLCHEQSQQIIQDTYMLAHTLDALQENDYPFTKPIEQHDVEKMDISYALNTYAGNRAKELLELAHYIRNETAKIQEFGSLVFYIYFKELYDGMKERTISEQYFTLMFDENCIIKATPQHTFMLPLTDANLSLFKTH